MFSPKFLMAIIVAALFSSAAQAGPFDVKRGQPQGVEQFVPQSKARGKRVEPREVKLDDRQAAERVKRTYQEHKILSINLIESKGPGVYRVKTLSREGVIKYVFVDGDSGDVFE